MKKIELAGALTVLGVLVVSQWNMKMDMDTTMETAGNDGEMAEMNATMPNMATANLIVTGMT